MGEHVDVLLRSVHDGDRLALEQATQLGDVDGERVDESDVVGRRELHERQLGEEGPLAVELGVERVPRLPDEDIDERDEVVVAVDPSHRRGRSQLEVAT